MDPPSLTLREINVRTARRLRLGLVERARSKVWCTEHRWDAV
jgi:hypothetical protein